MEHFTLNLELMVEIIIRKFYLVWKCIFFMKMYYWTFYPFGHCVLLLYFLQNI